MTKVKVRLFNTVGDKEKFAVDVNADPTKVLKVAREKIELAFSKKG